MLIRQQALTVVARVKATKRDDLTAFLAASAPRVRDALQRVSTIHFGRFVVFDDDDAQTGPGAARKSWLAFESNFDGEKSAHLRELRAALGGDLDAIFNHCDEYDSAQFDAFIAQHSVAASAFYLGHPGLAAAQIKHDMAVREAIEAWLDTQDKAGALSDMGPREIHEALRQMLVAAGLKVGGVDRGLPRKPWATMKFYALVPPLLGAFGALACVARWYEADDERSEVEAPPKFEAEDSARLTEIFLAEDDIAQNGLTHVVPIKAGPFRRHALRFALVVVETFRKCIAFEGDLAGLSTIHFARWVVLDSGHLLFFSNYDGSWESYLGDFIDKVDKWLSFIWTNTKWFPRTRYLILDGAADEVPFKRWTRTFQQQNAIWYSAYPGLTVQNVLNNAKIRELADGEMDDDDATQWLALL